MSAALTPESAAFKLRAIAARLPSADPRRVQLELRLGILHRRDPVKALEDISTIARQLANEAPGGPLELRRDVAALRTEIAQAVAALRRSA